MSKTIIPTERWAPVVGYEGLYEASDLGAVRSVDRTTSAGRRRRGRLLKPTAVRGGHLRVELSRDGVGVRHYVHILVMQAFVGEKPDGMEVCHYNDDPQDNRLSNLRYDSHSANGHDSVRNGSHAQANKTHCPRGHQYTSGNTYVTTQGWRVCRECKNMLERARCARAA